MSAGGKHQPDRKQSGSSHPLPSFSSLLGPGDATILTPNIDFSHKAAIFSLHHPCLCLRDTPLTPSPANILLPNWRFINNNDDDDDDCNDCPLHLHRSFSRHDTASSQSSLFSTPDSRPHQPRPPNHPPFPCPQRHFLSISCISALAASRAGSRSHDMDTNMEDVGRPPTDVSPVINEPATIPTLDGWIESLMSCKQLAEADVQRLCDKVRNVSGCSSDVDRAFADLQSSSRRCLSFFFSLCTLVRDWKSHVASTLTYFAPICATSSFADVPRAIV